MKKICVLISILSSLHGAEENLTLRMRTTSAWSLIQTRWPLSTPLTLAGCGAAAMYVGYKVIMQHRSSVKNSEKSEALLHCMLPYLYAYHAKNYSREPILNIVASTDEVIKLLPEAIATSDVEQRKKYLDNNIFTQRGKEHLAKNWVSKPTVEQGQYNGNTTVVINGCAVFYQMKATKADVHDLGYDYSLDCIVSDIDKCDPFIFFESRDFLLNNNLRNHALNVNFKSKAQADIDGYYDVRLSIVKANGFVKAAMIYDYRGEILIDNQEQQAQSVN